MSKPKHSNMAMEAALRGVSLEMRQRRMREELAKAESSPSRADLEACEVCEGGGSILIDVKHS